MPQEQESNRIDLTPDEAIGVLSVGEYVHTFRNPGGMLVGADWDRADIEAAIRESDVRTLTGSMARAMGHGLAINAGGRPLFVETDETALSALESAKVPA